VAAAAEVVEPQEEEVVQVVDSVIEEDVVVDSVVEDAEPQEVVDSVVEEHQEVDVVVEEVLAVEQESEQELEY
jgi:hypothetical protein